MARNGDSDDLVRFCVDLYFQTRPTGSTDCGVAVRNDRGRSGAINICRSLLAWPEWLHKGDFVFRAPIPLARGWQFQAGRPTRSTNSACDLTSYPCLEHGGRRTPLNLALGKLLAPCAGSCSLGYCPLVAMACRIIHLRLS